MTVPVEYQRARDDFYNFLLDARDTAGLGTTNQAYTMVQGVFRTFRRRLDLKDAIRFAGVLPAALRALFVADWNPEEPRRPFENRAVITQEVRALRADHNFAPETAIQDVARALSWRAFRQAPRSSGDHEILAIHSTNAAKRDEFPEVFHVFPNSLLFLRTTAHSSRR